MLRFTMKIAIAACLVTLTAGHFGAQASDGQAEVGEQRQSAGALIRTPSNYVIVPAEYLSQQTALIADLNARLDAQEREHKRAHTELKGRMDALGMEVLRLSQQTVSHDRTVPRGGAASIVSPQAGSQSQATLANFLKSLPLENKDASFEGYDAKYKGADTKAVYDATLAIFNRYKNRKAQTATEGIFFGGRAGIGKTTLAIALGKKCIENGYSVKFIKIEDMMDLHFVAMESAKESLLKHDVFILDDFNGAKAGMEEQFLSYFLLKLHDIGNKLVFVTSNRPYDAFVKSTFPTVSFSFDKEGKITAEHKESLNNTQRVQRRVCGIFEGRFFFVQ
jgi:DNA replication protein DnaC